MTDDPQTSYEIDSQGNQPSTLQWALIIVVGLVTVCGILLFLSGGAFTAFSLFNQQQARVTERVAIPTATVGDQYQSDFQAAAGWPLLLYDTFDDNRNQWIDGEIDDDYASIQVSIHGAYTWNVLNAKQGFTWRVWPQMEELSDFYLAVDTHNQGENLDAQYGLIFRNQGDDYYYFEVRDGQYFRFYLFEDYQWKELLPYTYSAAIRPGEVNRLTVLSQDDQFTLWINDQFVGQTRGSSPSQGQVGVIVGLAYADEQSLIVFDNFEVRVPELPVENPQ